MPVNDIEVILAKLDDLKSSFEEFKADVKDSFKTVKEENKDKCASCVPTALNDQQLKSLKIQVYALWTILGSIGTGLFVELMAHTTLPVTQIITK